MNAKVNSKIASAYDDNHLTVEKRVGLFIASYPWGSAAQLTNVAFMLMKNGYYVDIFMYHMRRTHLLTVEAEKLRIYDLACEECENASIITTVPPPISIRTPGPLFRGIYHKFAGRGKSVVRRLIWRTFPEVMSRRRYREEIFPKAFIQRAQNITSAYTYTCFLGFNPRGLVLSSLAKKNRSIPVIYYSLELFDVDHPFYEAWRPAYRVLKSLERKYHQYTESTIIQDQERAKLLMQYNHISDFRTFFVPVGIIGAPIKTKSKFLHHFLGISSDKRIILQTGNITPRRKSLELARQACYLPDNWVMVLHGFMKDEVAQELEYIRQNGSNGKLYVSGNSVEFNQLNQLTASADIGLTFYCDDYLNDYLIGHSSENLARYLQCGLPVISIDHPSLKTVIEQYQSGICIKNIENLPEAVITIEQNYQKYRLNAFHCFEVEYEFERHFIPVVKYIDALSTSYEHAR